MRTRSAANYGRDEEPQTQLQQKRAQQPRKRRAVATPQQPRDISPRSVAGSAPQSLPTVQASGKKKARASHKKKAPAKTQATTIAALAPEDLCKIFASINGAPQGFFMNVLPLVCRKWCTALRGPSQVWKVSEPGPLLQRLSVA